MKTRADAPGWYFSDDDERAVDTKPFFGAALYVRIESAPDKLRYRREATCATREQCLAWLGVNGDTPMTATEAGLSPR